MSVNHMDAENDAATVLVRLWPIQHARLPTYLVHGALEAALPDHARRHLLRLLRVDLQQVPCCSDFRWVGTYIPTRSDKSHRPHIDGSVDTTKPRKPRSQITYAPSSAKPMLS